MGDDRLRQRLDRAGGGIAVADPATAFAGVQSMVRRRRRRRLVSAGLAIVAAFAGGVVILISLDDSGEQAIRSAPSTATLPAAGDPPGGDADAPSTSGPVAAPPPIAAPADEVDAPPPSFGTPEGIGDVAWLVPWRNGFLAGGSQVVPQPVAQFTLDGVGWTAVEMAAPAGLTGLSHVTAAGDRLVAVGSGGRSKTIVVASTTDLVDWEIQTFDVARPADLPDEVFFNASTADVVANESGWLVTIETSAHVRVDSRIPEDVRERMLARNGSISIEDDGVRVEIGATADEPAEQLDYTWDDLGIAPDGVPYVNVFSGRAEMWAAPFGGEPQRSTEEFVFAPTVVAMADHFVELDHLVDFRRTIRTSPDGLTWTTVADPLDNRFGAVVTSTGKGLVVYTLGNPAGDAYLVDAPLTDWRRVGIAGLPEFLGPVLSSDPGAPVLVFDGSLPGSALATMTIDADPFRVIQTDSGSTRSYELVDIATGDVVLAETVDVLDPLVGGADGPFEYMTGSIESGMTFLDPASGEVLLNIPQDVVETAIRDALARLDADTVAYRPDRWLVAATRAGGWLIEDIPDDPSWVSPFRSPYPTAISGDTLLVAIGDRWFRFDLGA